PTWPAQDFGPLTAPNVRATSGWLALTGASSVIRLEMTLQAEDYEALAAFRYAIRKFLRFSKEALAGAKLTPEQYEALLAIKSRGANGLTVGGVGGRAQGK